MSDKIEVIENLLGKVDALVIGGAMAYTFFKSRGVPVGKSLVEDDKLEAARSITAARQASAASGWRCRSTTSSPTKLEAGRRARGARGGRSRRSATGWAWTSGRDDGRALPGAGRRTRRRWSGTGRWASSRSTPFDAGTNAVAQAVATVKGTTIIGGGDSVSAVTKAGVADQITHISTGGGASLEFLGGRTLPGVAALADK